jgi:hypothetical protein
MPHLSTNRLHASHPLQNPPLGEPNKMCPKHAMPDLPSSTESFYTCFNTIQNYYRLLPLPSPSTHVSTPYRTTIGYYLYRVLLHMIQHHSDRGLLWRAIWTPRTMDTFSPAILQLLVTTITTRNVLP